MTEEATRPKDFWIIVALDANCDEAWIVQKSEDCSTFDLIDGSEASDTGIDMTWSKGRRMGLYKLRLSPWSNQDHEGEWDTGCDATVEETLFETPEAT